MKKRVSFEFTESSLTLCNHIKLIELSSGKVIALPKCEHLHVTVYWKLYAMETRYEPAEYIGKAHCEDCGEWMEPEDVPDEAERKDVTK